MAVTRLMVREAIAYTARQADPSGLHVYPYMHPTPTAPAVCVGLEYTDFVGDMAAGMITETWRLWLLLNPGSDWLEAQRQADLYLDYTGEKSLHRAFRASLRKGDGADAYWRGTEVSEVRLLRYSRMPSDVQGPNIIDWMGSPYWGVPIEVKVMYGRQ